MAEKKITLAIGGVDYEFKVSTQDFNNFVNRVGQESKVVPAINLVRGCLMDKEQKDALNDLIDRGYALDIAGKLIEEFHPELEIEVKK